MLIRYSPAAREDLRRLHRYLVSEFGQRTADLSVQRIVRDISILKQQVNLLRPLADKIHRATDYQYCLCGRYSIVILLKSSKNLSVVRILDGRTDYVTEIFG